jgi:hypothetical protein
MLSSARQSLAIPLKLQTGKWQIHLGNSEILKICLVECNTHRSLRENKLWLSH